MGASLVAMLWLLPSTVKRGSILATTAASARRKCLQVQRADGWNMCRKPVGVHQFRLLFSVRETTR
jgi:hypothetical protein